MSFVLILILFGIGLIGLVLFLRLTKKRPWGEIVLLLLSIFSLLWLLIGLVLHGTAEYDTAIDPVDNCYTPFNENHVISVLFYAVTYFTAILLVWIKGRNLPPLFLVFCLVFIYIGIVLFLISLAQVSQHNTRTLSLYKGDDGGFWFLPFFIINLIIGIVLVLKTIRMEQEIAKTRSFKNNFLNACNKILTSHLLFHTWALVLLLPVFVITTLILILLGQEYNSLVKVFTDTTTWAFSQKMHPPPLDHQGHYLCTVAACGKPEVVKPLFVGKRHGKPIIVNRQLQIANAFEELVSDISPKFHHWIRKNYDKYGYNLSKKINTKRTSTVTYILMKPLEIFFLACLYLFVTNPETKIKKQYSN